MKFCCEDKYGVIISALEARGWIHEPLGFDEKLVLPADCELIWCHLQRLQFAGVFGRLVNHLRGSNHLSNKAFLLYHLKSTSMTQISPISWSPAYQGIPELLLMLVLNGLYSLAKEYTADSLGNNEDWMHRYFFYRRLISKIDTSAEESLINDFIEIFDENNVIDVDKLSLYILTAEAADPRRQYGGDKDIWIVKPVGSSCGNGIIVLQGIHEVMRRVETEYAYKCIVQKYIERPFLVRGGRKFDIRQWVLVFLRVYGFSELYLRLSSATYTLTDLTSAHIHLCNHAVQKNVPVTENIQGMGHLCDTMMTHAEFLDALDAHGCSSKDIAMLLLEMRSMCVATVRSALDRLDRVGRGFEWLGLDIMLSDALEPMIIECNVSPDISPSTAVTTRLVEAAAQDLFALLLDEGAVVDISREGATPPRMDRRPSGDPEWTFWHMESPKSSPKIRAMTIEKNKILTFDPECIPKNVEGCISALTELRVRNAGLFNNVSPIEEDEI